MTTSTIIYVTDAEKESSQEVQIYQNADMHVRRVLIAMNEAFQ